MTKVVIFGRVSTINQDYQRQVNELNTLAKRNKWSVAKTFTEKVSGAKKNTERPELMKMLHYIDTNKVQKVIVSELSRIGRNTLESLKVIELLNERKVSLYIKHYNIETLTAKGEKSPMASFLITILAEVAAMERDQIYYRMKSGYDNARKNGVIVGRKEGYVKPVDELLAEHKDIVKLLNKNVSIRNISAITKKSTNTVQKVKRELQES